MPQAEPRIAGFPQGEELAAIRRRARSAARRFRLPFRSRLWRGSAGNWSGAGVGASIDFQDHRPYLPGDDPRHIDWQVYARTGAYSMKLYREEVSPFVDLVLDASGSMLYAPVKRDAALEAFFFYAESALASGAFFRAMVVRGEHIRELDAQSVFAPEPRWPSTDGAGDGVRALARIPWRSGSLRILVSDCLFPAAPETIVRRLAPANGRGVVVAPSWSEESDPGWSGNLTFLDVESDARREARADGEVLQRYGAAYRRHFEQWEEACARMGVAFLRLPAERGLTEALRAEASRGGGAVDPWA